MMASIKYFISHDIKNRFKNAVTLLTSNVTVMMGQGLQGQKEMYIYIFSKSNSFWLYFGGRLQWQQDQQWLASCHPAYDFWHSTVQAYYSICLTACSLANLESNIRMGRKIWSG